MNLKFPALLIIGLIIFISGCTISPMPPVCGDNVCDVQGGEKNPDSLYYCPDDCGAAEDCGNGICDEDETADSCPEDCQASGYCGDGTCDENENNETCPDDCGVQPVCGNGVCEEGEDLYSCEADCGTSRDKTVYAWPNKSEARPFERIYLGGGAYFEGGVEKLVIDSGAGFTQEYACNN